MNLSLENKRALICGSSQGIGFAIAQELALLGASCILLARNEDALKKAITHLDEGLGQRHEYIVADLEHETDLRSKIDAQLKHGSIHILINNSGGPPPGPVLDAEPAAFIAAFNQHIIRSHELTQALVPGMKQEGYGRIINIVSTSVRIPIANLGVSNTIRGATASWAKTMANELGKFKITVNNILPGLTRTRRLESLIANTARNKNEATEKVERDMQFEIPAGRFAEPSEIAAVAAFLASPSAAYVNGTSIPVDGGKTGSI